MKSSLIELTIDYIILIASFVVLFSSFHSHIGLGAVLIYHILHCLVRACRNSIEFNSIPSINRLVPGGYDALKLDVILAVPPKYQKGLDLEAVAKVFPYGETKFTIQDGGMIAPSGIAISALGDVNDDMVIVCASVTVGY